MKAGVQTYDGTGVMTIMIGLDIPGRGALNLEVAVFDYNGTLAVDGQMLGPVAEGIRRLVEEYGLEVHILTSDTFGTVNQQCRELPVTIQVLRSKEHTAEKAAYLERFGERQVVAVGNGSNDEDMLKRAALGVVIIGGEGCSSRALTAADVAVNRVEDALGLLLNPKRLVATLRR
ncbi:HAD family hydrolase [Acididesulfobacillus acetoxydans]|uniref:HAD family hydrolase n=1 Tax=Acididesulfobacillus acetoxydans TaxID=1561005 RepID=UPI002795CC95|nr:ATPase P [Acididesulfobacillus acetoxydans]